jgi:hypothetical protein
MIKTFASAVFLLDSLVIGLGAFGHGMQVRHLHAAIDGYPIEADMHSMLYIVWFFVSGCMLTFGATLLWVWSQLRRGNTRTFPLAALIGLLYIGIGGFGLIYRDGDPFMAFFVALGAVLLLSGYTLASRSPAAH